MIHLHLHTRYSIREALGSSQDYAELCEPGDVLAITDLDTLAGVYEHAKACKARDVTPIFGMQSSHLGGVILLAMNDVGWRNLCELRYLGDDLTFERMADLHEGLIVLGGGWATELGRELDRQDRSRVDAWVDLVGDRFYLEAIDHGYIEHDAWAEELELMGIPIVRTHDVRWPRPEQARDHAVMLCSQTKKKLYSIQALEGVMYRGAHLRRVDVTATQREVAERCNFELEHKSEVMYIAHFEVPKGFDGDQQEYMTSLALEELAARGVADDPVYQARLEEEIRVVASKGFVGYYLIVADYVRWAKSQGIWVGPGRGSGAGSLLAYGLKITGVDPVKHGLYFERFLNPERESMPDFDVDFQRDRRQEVLAYIRERWGEDFVSQISTWSTPGGANGFKIACRPMGVYPNQALEVSKALQEAARTETELDTSGYDEKILHALELASGQRATLTDRGLHGGAMIIASRPVREITPVSDGACEIDHYWAEGLGLIKFDVLGLVEGEVIRRIEASVGAVDFDEVGYDDPKTWELLSAGHGVGVFQCGGFGIQRLMRQIKPDSLEVFAALIALYRPGPLDSGMAERYVKRRDGLEEPEVLHESLWPALEETFGVIIYQEQVMNLARIAAGYSLGEADILRRAMGKKKADVMASQKKRFVEQSTIGTELAEKLFDLIEKFASYGFNKSHAMVYAVIAYQTAWFKANHPAELIAAQLYCRGDSLEGAGVFVREARRMGLTVLSPCISRPGSKWWADEQGRVVAGIDTISGMGAVHVPEWRGADHAVDWLLTLSQGVIKDLALAGALDVLSGIDAHREPRRLLAWRTRAHHLLGKLAKKGDEHQPSLFSQAQLHTIDSISRGVTPLNVDASVRELEKSYEKRGYWCDLHPAHLAYPGYTNMASLTEVGQRVPVRIERVRFHISKTSKRPMGFLTVSDRTGTYDVTMMPDAWAASDGVEEGELLVLNIKQELYNGSLGYIAI